MAGGLLGSLFAALDHVEAAAISLTVGVGVGVVSIDASERRIPTRLIWIGAAGLMSAALIDFASHHDAAPLVAGLIAAGVIGVAFGLVYLWRPEAMGFGDVRLATLTAGTVGWGVGAIAAALAAVLVASVGASVTMLILRKRSLPFAPFLVPAALVTIAFG
ncbi:prepilin peptidase [Ilumatobacter nonamiensis]|uniref:prepilin peptidase n=1 Tax=Ilumatobacter nonamiensis TaxID=467093 RepID=UPI00130DAFAA|nr:prepilin peptidase [Ilumatobacter nonamiensis]